MRCHVLFVLSALILFATAAASTYSVRPDGTGDFPTIQAAVDAAVNGDVVSLVAGTFTGNGNRDVDLLGKAITIRSESGDPASVIIDCEGQQGPPHRGFAFRTDEGPETVLEGVTVINGMSHGFAPMTPGGAVMCLQSSPTIRDCVFEGNWSLDIERTSVGGAVSSGSGAVTLIRCVFRGNRADIGGAIFGGFALIQDCTFCENEAGVEGGAMDLVRCEPLITGCTLAGNSAPMGGGIFASICPARIEKTIIANSTQGAALVVSDSEVTLSCCDLVGNAGGDWVGSIADQYGVDGNICEDPLFCGAGCDDLALHADSPCAPEHNPDCGLVGAWPVGCEQAPIEVTTWGAIKALFR